MTYCRFFSLHICNEWKYAFLNLAVAPRTLRCSTDSKRLRFDIINSSRCFLKLSSSSSESVDDEDIEANSSFFWSSPNACILKARSQKASFALTYWFSVAIILYWDRNEQQLTKCHSRSGNPLDLTIWVTTAKMAINVLGAQVRFLTTEQFFSSSSNMKNQSCCISKNFLQKQMYFPWVARKVTPAKIAKSIFRCNRRQLSLSYLRSLAYSSIKMPDLFMQKWHWRPAVVQQHSFCYHRLGNHCHLGSTPHHLLIKHKTYAYFDMTARQNASRKSAPEAIRLLNWKLYQAHFVNRFLSGLLLSAPLICSCFPLHCWTCAVTTSITEFLFFKNNFWS